MAAADFDTHKFAKRLQDAGELPAVADVHAEVAGEMMHEIAAVNTRVDQLGMASGADCHRIESRLIQFEQRVDARFEEFEQRVDARFKHAEATANARFEQLDLKIETRYAQLDAKIEMRYAQLDAKIDKVAAELRTEIMRWSIAQAAVIVGALTAIQKLFP